VKDWEYRKFKETCGHIVNGQGDRVVEYLQPREAEAILALRDSHAALTLTLKLAAEFIETELEQRQESGIPAYIMAADNVLAACNQALANAAKLTEEGQNNG